MQVTLPINLSQINLSHPFMNQNVKTFEDYMNKQTNLALLYPSGH